MLELIFTDFATFAENYRTARKLTGVRVAGFITGGTWEDEDGEIIFAYASRLPIRRIVSAYCSVQVAVDDELHLARVKDTCCRYVIKIIKEGN